MKNQYIAGNLLKTGGGEGVEAWTVCRFIAGGGLGKKEVGCLFEGC